MQSSTRERGLVRGFSGPPKHFCLTVSTTKSSRSGPGLLNVKIVYDDYVDRTPGDSMYSKTLGQTTKTLSHRVCSLLYDTFFGPETSVHLKLND